MQALACARNSQKGFPVEKPELGPGEQEEPAEGVVKCIPGTGSGLCGGAKQGGQRGCFGQIRVTPVSYAVNSELMPGRLTRST